ncbi:MAG: hypothetical protein ACR2ME_07385 [Acidimicrobiia bacterium]
MQDHGVSRGEIASLRDEVTDDPVDSALKPQFPSQLSRLAFPVSRQFHIQGCFRGVVPEQLQMNLADTTTNLKD